MSSSEITEKDRELAQKCVDCTLCVKARKNQRGFFFWFVKFVEGGVCPACKAYEKVYGRKAHEPVPTGG
ncbi:MAG TPA: hypothetical protein VE960_04950 [bacterium]|nr:hypothetical protein [bacterium]